MFLLHTLFVRQLCVFSHYSLLFRILCVLFFCLAILTHLCAFSSRKGYISFIMSWLVWFIHLLHKYGWRPMSLMDTYKYHKITKISKTALRLLWSPRVLRSPRSLKLKMYSTGLSCTGSNIKCFFRLDARC